MPCMAHQGMDAYDTDQIVIRWNGKHPIEVNSEIRMPDMRLRAIQHVIRNDTYSYVPTALIVVISWFSFWLDVEAVPGRASYVKAIDVWMGACMAFVFSAMIEFTVVNYCTRRKQRKVRSTTKSLSEQYQNGSTPYEPTSVDATGNFLPSIKRKAIEERISRVEENRKYAQLIDRRSRVYFPLAYILFNFIYWVYYIKFAEDTIE
ncbi:Neurotransmitter-gated ion-channel transmembrane region [Ostertagia ostertagi]